MMFVKKPFQQSMRKWTNKQLNIIRTVQLVSRIKSKWNQKQPLILSLQTMHKLID
jgi:hypothetical protein